MSISFREPLVSKTSRCLWVLVTVLLISVAGCHYHTAHVWRPLLQNVRDLFTLSLLGPIVAFKLAVWRLVLNWLKQRRPVLVTFHTIIDLKTCAVWHLKSRLGTTPNLSQAVRPTLWVNRFSTKMWRNPLLAISALCVDVLLILFV